MNKVLQARSLRSDVGVTFLNGVESFLVVEVQENQDTDPIFLELKGAVYNHRVEVFSQWKIVYFATRIDCVLLMWASSYNIFLQNPITLDILFVQVPLRFIAICRKSTDGMT